jgi:hypothetical protein
MKAKLNLVVILLLMASCASEKTKDPSLFELLESEDTGIYFRNDLAYTEKINPYTFRNFYNGAGVAIGDINNDGLVDIFLTGNQTSNKLYLNQGNLKFKDITDDAGLNSHGYWSTGVSMADVNGDGLLDIYVCKSGPTGGEKRHNELFINNGNLTFSEQSKAYGIDEIGLSQHAVFFDFDKDGDLDMYLLSNSARPVGVFDLRQGQRDQRDSTGGNKLFRNIGGRFEDVSAQAGIYGSAIGYGLGVTVADLNGDHWPDLYVSNDFFERDYLYLNNQDGTFTEILPEILPEISMGSMGADIADLDNDTRPDIFVTEMLPKELARVKTKTPFEDWDKYQANVKAGYHHQFTRNTLQRNLGFRPGTQTPVFAEVSRLAGVEATDWSWGALIFDVDNDGLKDIFVANGIVKDLTDFDFVDFYVNNQEKVEGYRQDSLLITKMIDAFPSIPQANFLFKNSGNWSFVNQAEDLGLHQLTFSTGSAYGDLDNDGDLDLVINNLNEQTFILKNNSSETSTGNYLSLELGNAFGTKVTAFAGDRRFYQEYQPVKGYMSSVDPRLHFGLGKIEILDSIQVIWPDGKTSSLLNVKANQALRLSQNEKSEFVKSLDISAETIFKESGAKIQYRHQESDFIDFDRDRLRFWMISNEGPRAAKADVNGDGLEDLFIPGAKGQASGLFYQTRNGEFAQQQGATFELDAISEDVTAHFFDANGDGAPDLLVGSGGIEFGDFSPSYADRLYLNDGRGNLQKTTQVFPAKPTAFILSYDIDEDGDLDLIVGSRSVPFAYGIPTGIDIWENDGRGVFTEITASFHPALSELGMLTAGALEDLDLDGKKELILVGEWMSIRIFTLAEGKLTDTTKDFGFENTEGLWNSLLVADVNGDGLPDILAGNHGLNSRLRTSPSSELRMVLNDFDQNGTLDHILARYESQQTVPWVLKPALLRQIPSLRKQLLTYESYKNTSLEELFPKSVWANSLILRAQTLKTTLWINSGQGRFTPTDLPVEIQSAPVYAIAAVVRDKQMPYLVFGGNQSRVKPELGSQMGSYTWVLAPTGTNQWETLLPEQSGIFVSGEIRDFIPITTKNQPNLVVLRNNDIPLVFEIH